MARILAHFTPHTAAEKLRLKSLVQSVIPHFNVMAGEKVWFQMLSDGSALICAFDRPAEEELEAVNGRLA